MEYCTTDAFPRMVIQKRHVRDMCFARDSASSYCQSAHMSILTGQVCQCTPLYIEERQACLVAAMSQSHEESCVVHEYLIKASEKQPLLGLWHWRYFTGGV